MKNFWKKTFLPCFLCVLTLYIARYGAGFTWRQVFVGLLVFAIWKTASDLQQPPERKFQRIQFRIALNICSALVDAGINSEEEVKHNKISIEDSLGQYASGRITFTWLENDLFFMNNSNSFTKSPKLTISLKPFGERAVKIGDSLLSDCLELSENNGAYELELIKSENRYNSDHPSGTVILRLPYEFFHSLQSYPAKFNKIKDHIKRQDKILESAGLKYKEDQDVYIGRYADLCWWDL